MDLKNYLTLVPLLLGVALVAACGQPVGTDCMISGSGFHAKDPCTHKCLSRWSVTCPNETKITPNMCTGNAGCTPGTCGSGLVCYSFDDPFEEQSYCVPETLCGDDLSPVELLNWEQDSASRAAALREKYAAKSAKRTSQTTQVAPDAEELTAPEAQE